MPRSLQASAAKMKNRLFTRQDLFWQSKKQQCQQSPAKGYLQSAAELAAEYFWPSGAFALETGALLGVHLCEHLMDPPLLSLSPPPPLPPSPPLQTTHPLCTRGLSKPDIKSIWGNSPSICRSTFPPPLPLALLFFLGKDNFGKYFMGYIASVSLCRAGRVARNDD